MTAAPATPVRLASKYPHLGAALLAALLCLGIAQSSVLVGRTLIRRRIDQLVPLNFTNKWRGEVVQQELLRHRDVLAMYGSSELVTPVPNRASELFASRPTGFAVAPIGDRGMPMVMFLLELASADRVAFGRRMVLSLSATWFLDDNKLTDRQTIAAHASALQAGDAIFRAHLPRELRRRIAERIASIPEATERQSLLGASVSCLAVRCAAEWVLPAFAPLWTLRSLPLRVEDVVQAMLELRQAPLAPVRRAERIDWPAREAQSDSAWHTRSNNNRFGIENTFWTRYAADVFARPVVSHDSQFVDRMVAAPRWRDLTLLLETARAIGARPLVLDSPLRGAYWDRLGVSEPSRMRFYQHFDSVTEPFAFPTRNFREHDADPNFLRDIGSHPSEKGWMVYDHAIDAFYHDTN